MTFTPDMLKRELLGPEIQARLRDGIPEIGWQGDPWLTVFFNHLTDSWEIWDEYSEKPRLVAQKRNDSGEINIHTLCAHLRDHDLRRMTMADIEDRIDDHNDAIERAQTAAMEDKMGEQLERVVWAIGQDEGITRPVVGFGDLWRSSDKQ